MLNNQHSQPLRCHTNESPDMPVRFRHLHLHECESQGVVGFRGSVSRQR